MPTEFAHGCIEMASTDLAQFSAGLLCCLVLSGHTAAETSKEYAVMARTTWSAFECSSLASKAGRTDEQRRLFLYGYDQGLKFIAAVKANKVEQADLTTEAPIGVLFLLEGPTPDFMLGRIFESAQDSVLKPVYVTGEHLNSEIDQKIISQNEFTKRNCQLIGRRS